MKTILYIIYLPAFCWWLFRKKVLKIKNNRKFKKIYFPPEKKPLPDALMREPVVCEYDNSFGDHSVY